MKNYNLKKAKCHLKQRPSLFSKNIFEKKTHKPNECQTEKKQRRYVLPIGSRTVQESEQDAIFNPNEPFDNTDFKYDNETSRSMISEKIRKPKNIFQKSASQEAKDYEKWMTKHIEEIKDDLKSKEEIIKPKKIKLKKLNDKEMSD